MVSQTSCYTALESLEHLRTTVTMASRSLWSSLQVTRAPLRLSATFHWSGFCSARGRPPSATTLARTRASLRSPRTSSRRWATVSGHCGREGIAPPSSSGRHSSTPARFQHGNSVGVGFPPNLGVFVWGYCGLSAASWNKKTTSSALPPPMHL